MRWSPCSAWNPFSKRCGFPCHLHRCDSGRPARQRHLHCAAEIHAKPTGSALLVRLPAGEGGSSQEFSECCCPPERELASHPRWAFPKAREAAVWPLRQTTEPKHACSSCITPQEWNGDLAETEPGLRASPSKTTLGEEQPPVCQAGLKAVLTTFFRMALFQAHLFWGEGGWVDYSSVTCGGGEGDICSLL